MMSNEKQKVIQEYFNSLKQCQFENNHLREQIIDLQKQNAALKCFEEYFIQDTEVKKAAHEMALACAKIQKRNEKLEAVYTVAKKIYIRLMAIDGLVDEMTFKELSRALKAVEENESGS